jgi:hypothetical protein
MVPKRGECKDARKVLPELATVRYSEGTEIRNHWEQAMSNKYAEAIAAHNAAFAKFDAVRSDYRAMKVGDAEFLAAKKEYDAATAVYDEAFAKEAA